MFQDVLSLSLSVCMYMCICIYIYNIYIYMHVCMGPSAQALMVPLVFTTRRMQKRLNQDSRALFTMSPRLILRKLIAIDV